MITCTVSANCKIHILHMNSYYSSMPLPVLFASADMKQYFFICMLDISMYRYRCRCLTSLNITQMISDHSWWHLPSYHRISGSINTKEITENMLLAVNIVVQWCISMYGDSNWLQKPLGPQRRKQSSECCSVICALRNDTNSLAKICTSLAYKMKDMEPRCWRR